MEGVRIKKRKPIIYSCSGCSNVAQLANDIAVKISDDDIAEMSCIAGIGGKVKPLLRKARSGRPIIIIDGCSLECGKACLDNVNIKPDEHVILTDYNLKKKNSAKLKLGEHETIYSVIVEKIENISKNESK